MDLIQIGQTIMRHKWVTLPIVCLTLIALFYVTALKPKPYTANVAYMLIPPNTANANNNEGNAQNNPFVRFGDLSVIVDMLTEQMSANPLHANIVKQGADPNFTVTADGDYGASPILETTGNGPSAVAAEASANIAGHAAVSLLENLQVQQGVDRGNRITMLLLQPANATLKASSVVRSAAGVLVAGGLVLAMAVSFASGLADVRRKPNQKDPRPGAPGISPMEHDPLELDGPMQLDVLQLDRYVVD
jgi:hypothetical protein